MRSIKFTRGTLSFIALTYKQMRYGFVVAIFFSHLVSATDSGAQTPRSNPSTSEHQSTDSKPQVLVAKRLKLVSFEQEIASEDTQQIANWVVNSNDNRNMPFVIIDKASAKVFAFSSEGQLRGVAAALLGLSKGDDAVPGIGSRKLSSILISERTTPAGRFVASLAHNLHGEEILWVDYDTAISLHRVHAANLLERRVQRLSSPTILDNRISFGCINVPEEFYQNVISPAFTGTNGIVYVLPETRSISEVFAVYGFVAKNK